MFVLAGALQGLGKGMLDLAKDVKADAQAGIKQRRDLSTYRSKKKIDAEFKGGGSRRSGGGSRSSGGGSRSSGGSSNPGPDAPRLGKNKDLSHAFADELREYWNSKDSGANPANELMYLDQAEKLRGAGYTRTQIKEFFKRPGIYTDEGIDWTATPPKPERVPEKVAGPGPSVGGANSLPNDPPAPTGFGPSMTTPTVPGGVGVSVPGGPVRVQSIEEARSLEPGTQFYDPNGVLRVR